MKYIIKATKGRPTKKRITLDIPLPIFEGLTRVLQLRYCSMTKWINRAIVEKMQQEEKYWKE